MLCRLWARIRAQGPVWLAGFILIAAGIICLYLSDKVVTGWWQGTLDAFGVGFIIAGLVDVLAISALNQAQRRRANNNLEAERILRDMTDPGNKTADAAEELLKRAGGQINRILEQELSFLVFRLRETSQEDLRRQLDARLPPTETPDHGDAPQAPGNG